MSWRSIKTKTGRLANEGVGREEREREGREELVLSVPE